MIAHKKEFYTGLVMLIAFFVVLGVIFMPVFGGQNGLNYLDGLYNSISKGSAYYVPLAREKAGAFDGQNVEIRIPAGTEKQAGQMADLFRKSGGTVSVSPDRIAASGDLGRILGNCLEDADNMYANRGEAVSGKYGYGERRVLHNWWLALKAMEKDLKRQKRFAMAKVVSLVKKKAVETAYNYYAIEPQQIGDKLGIVVFSLVFYVIYTLWYGFAILFLFEGWGMKLGH